MMRKTFYFAAIVFFIVSSCSKDDETVTGQMVTTQSDTNVISGGGTIFNKIFSYSLVGESIDDPCTREVIKITSGNIVIDVQGIFKENNSTIIVQANVEGITATGKRGMPYTLYGSFNEQTSEYSNGVLTTRLQHFNRWIVPGSNNNVIVKDTYFIMVNAGGNVTLVREPVSEVYCR